MVRVSVKNFGPIAEGSVDLKPLTIFIGPSNTGKSFMAGAVYAVARGTEQVPFGHGSPSGDLLRRFSPRWTLPLITPSPTDEPPVWVEAIRDWLAERADKELSEQELTVSTLPEEVQSDLQRLILRLLGLLYSAATNQLRQAYGETSSLIRRGKATEESWLAIRSDFPMLDMEIQFTDDEKAPPEFDISQVSVLPFDTAHWLSDFGLGENEDLALYANFIHYWGGATAQHIFGGLPHGGIYLPAARSGIAQGHKVLAAALVGQSRRIGIEPMFFPALPGITTEFLSNLISLDRRAANLTSDDALAKAIGFIEHEVLHGSIDLDESSGLPFPDIAYEQDGAGKFTLDQTSSMVSELAPLVLFLKYLVRPGDLLILEEPESHLHPAAQRRMARGIVRLVNAGIKVLITTHSDLFVAQVNNLMRSKHASQRWLREKGFAPEECIDKENVGAYLFRWKEEQGGSVVEELEIRPDVGIDDAMFGEVVNEIYEETLLVERIRVP